MDLARVPVKTLMGRPIAVQVAGLEVDPAVVLATDPVGLVATLVIALAANPVAGLVVTPVVVLATGPVELVVTPVVAVATNLTALTVELVTNPVVDPTAGISPVAKPTVVAVMAATLAMGLMVDPMVALMTRLVKKPALANKQVGHVRLLHTPC